MKLFPLKIILSALLLMSVLVWARLMTASHAQTMKDLGCTTITTIPPSLECHKTEQLWTFGDPAPTKGFIDPDGIFHKELRLFQIDHKGDIHESPCLAQMEAAMRAMDQYLNPSFSTTINAVIDIRTRGQKLRAEADEADEYDKNLGLWSDAKRACWRQP